MSQGSSSDSDRSAPSGDISLGRELRRAREVRGISVQQIAQETKINERYIHALENDRLDLLPGQPYTANFVRSIARCIGADEEELIDYLNYHLRVMQPERHDEHRSGGVPRARPGLPLVLLLGAVLVIIALTVALRGGGKSSSRAARDGRESRGAVSAPALPTMYASATAPPEVALPSGPAPASATAVPASAARVTAPVLVAVAGASAPIASAPAPPSAPATASAPPGAEVPDPAPTVRLVWRSRAWVDTYQEGDDSPRVGMKAEGDEMTWTLDRPLTLKIGNAGKVDMFIDGQPAKALGSENETRRLSLDRRNWKSFLR